MQGAGTDELLHFFGVVGVKARHDTTVSHFLRPLTFVFQPEGHKVTQAGLPQKKRRRSPPLSYSYLGCFATSDKCIATSKKGITYW